MSGDADTTTADILSAQALGRWAGDRWIWRNLSLGLAAGERLALAGPTGSGKTLLLRTLAALDAADEGTVHFHGRALEPHRIPQFRGRVIYLLQRPAFAEGSVEENLALPFSFNLHVRARFDRERALGMLDALGRGPAFLGQAASQLSGGEGQIAALVRALQLDPEVLLLDEATAALDAETVARAEGLIEAWLVRGAGRACIWTSHDARQLARVATRRLEWAGQGASS